MEILTLLQDKGIINIVAVIGTVGIVAKMKKEFLIKVLEKIHVHWLNWLLRCLIAGIIAFGLTALVYSTNFNVLIWIRMSCLNWIFSWVLHDSIKNLFFKEEIKVNDLTGN